MKKTTRCVLIAFMALQISIWAQNYPIETVVSFDKQQPVAISVSLKNRVFIGFPNFLSDRYSVALMEISKEGNKPYPPKSAWNNWLKDHKDKTQFVSIQAMTRDAEDYLWVLDAAKPQLGETIAEGVKLVKIDLKTDKVVRVYSFSKEIASKNSFLNDIQIDLTHQRAYISETNLKSLIVINLKDGEVKEVLKEHPSMLADPNYVLKIDGKAILKQDGSPFVVHVNGIALSKDDKYFYYRAEIGTKLYRIATEYLSDFAATDAQLADKIEFLGEVGQSAGMIADKAGNIYMTDIANKMIKRLLPDGTLEILAQRDDFLWTDSLALNADETELFVTLAQINNMSWFNQGEDKTIFPYKVVKIGLNKLKYSK